MSVKIPQYKGITWKFMNGLVTFIHRIITDISSCIREPVAGSFCHSLNFMDQRQHAAIYNVMHISCNGNRNSTCHSSQ